MRARWFRACRGAIAFLGLVVLCTPVALATPPDETTRDTPVAAVEPSPPPAVEPSPPPAVDPPPAVEPPPVVEPSPPPSDEPPPAAEPPPSGSEPSPPPAVEVSPPAVEPSPPPAAESPSPPPAPVVAAARAAQPPPEEEPAPPEVEPVLPPASDPGCVFPQPDPALPEAECQVLASDCSVLGTDGPDILVGEATNDLICGLAGDDQIDGGEGDDAILGGEGNDRLTGGPGADCMFGQGGEDELVDVALDDVAAIEDGELIPSSEPGTLEGRGVTREGGCTVWAVKPATPPPPEQQGSVSGSVEAAGIVLELSQLINEASGDAPFPLDLPATARAEDGIVRLLLRCESTGVSGTLELLERRGGDTVRAGRAEFECTPPTEVVEIELEPAAAGRLDARGRLAVTVRVDAADREEDHDFRVTIRSKR